MTDFALGQSTRKVGEILLACRLRTLTHRPTRPDTAPVMEIADRPRCASKLIGIGKWTDEKYRVIRQFIKLLGKDSDFEKSISCSTDISARVRKQFKMIDELI